MAYQLADGFARGATTFRADPEDIVIITDPKHPRYDPRVDLELSEEFLDNIDKHGVIEPVIVTKDDDGKVELLAGRRRTRALRLVNRRRRTDGKEIHLMPCIYRAVKDDAEAVAINHASNLHEADSLTAIADKAIEFVERFGWTLPAVAQVFGRSEQTIKHWLSLRDSAAPVRAALDAGTVQLAAVVKLARLPKNEQVAELSRMKEAKASGASRTGSGLGRKKIAGLSREQIRRFYGVAKELGDEDLNTAVALVRFFIGEIKGDSLIRVCPALKPAVEVLALGD